MHRLVKEEGLSIAEMPLEIFFEVSEIFGLVYGAFCVYPGLDLGPFLFAFHLCHLRLTSSFEADLDFLTGLVFFSPLGIHLFGIDPNPCESGENRP